MAGNRNSGMCSPLWHVCAFYLPPRHYTCDKHLRKFVMRIIYKSVVNKKKHRYLPAGFCQNKSSEIATTPSTFINVNIVILLLFCRIKKKIRQ